MNDNVGISDNLQNKAALTDCKSILYILALQLQSSVCGEIDQMFYINTSDNHFLSSKGDNSNNPIKLIAL